MPYRGRLSALTAALVLTAACGLPSLGGRDDDADGDATPAPGGASPTDLVNLWRVSDAADLTDDTWVRFDGRGVSVLVECGMLTGTWSAGTHAFVAEIHGRTAGCGSRPMEAAWLTEAAAYEEAGAGWRLLDRSGDPLATLTVDGAPSPIEGVSPAYVQPPELTDQTRAALTLREPPSDLVTASAEDLLGRWVPQEEFANSPFLRFDADGTYQGTDGCNAASGRWAVDPSGVLLHTAGPTFLVGCQGYDAPGLFRQASWASIDGDGVLLLHNGDGKVIGELVRD